MTGTAREIESRGRTVVAVAVEGRLAGLIGGRYPEARFG